MNRREFLSPAHIFNPAGQIVSTLKEIRESLNFTEKPEEVQLVRFSRRAMATQFEILFPFLANQSLQTGTKALDLIDELEAQLTVYRSTSEISRINRLAPYAPFVVEENLFSLIKKAKEIFLQTRGAFDISMGPLIRNWGFINGPRRVPSDEEIGQSLEKTGMLKVILEEENKSVRFEKPGMELNLGSIGKGYALDRVAFEIEKEVGPSNFMLQGGFSSIFATGCPLGDGRGWMVSVRHPYDWDETIAQVWLQDQGLATSANTYQWMESGGKRFGHVLDPRTGWPAEGMASVTVIAPTAAEADALSTAIFILGKEFARQYCLEHPEIGVILLEDGEKTAMERFGLAVESAVCKGS